MHEMRLDRKGDAPIPDGYLLITNEIEFLMNAIAEPVPLQVRGDAICDWAEAFFKGRKLPYREVYSPSQELKTVCPRLSSEQASAVYRHLEERFVDLERPLTTSRLLMELFPGNLWSERPSREHGAEWLLWLYERRPDSWVEPLLSDICDNWIRQSDLSYQFLYSARNSDAALAILDDWLGIEDGFRATGLQQFPLMLPRTIVERARRVWKRRLVESKGSYFVELNRLPLPSSLLHVAAQEAMEFFKRYPAHLDEEIFQLLSRYLRMEEQMELRRWLRPKLPSDLPSTAVLVLEWFKNEYLPFRVWQSTHSVAESAEIVSKKAQQFASWYLHQYPLALAGDPARNYLSFERSAALVRPSGKTVTLLIVLDGLHLADARHLQASLESKTTRLTLADDGLAFSPLPTITRFCKEALLSGVPPNHAKELQPIGEVLPERKSPVERLRTANLGQLFVWRVMEPDSTYHKRNSFDTLRQKVEAQLDGVAAEIAGIVDQVPASIPLQIVLTADHGRLLATSVRLRTAPVGMEPKGRTAWGVVERDFPETGYFVEDDIAFLHKDRYGLPYHTAVILDESAFRTIDGKTGSELFPHGGAFPEEVIVPWFVYVRDANQPQVEVRLSGRGQAGRRAVLHIDVVNLGDIVVTCKRLRLLNDQKQWAAVVLDWDVSPRLSENQDQEIEPWPTAAEQKSMRAVIDLELENGLVFEIEGQLDLQIDEMYERSDDILEGLDL